MKGNSGDTSEHTNTMKLYTYQACSTCKTAVKWLRSRGISFQELPIREVPPSLTELRAMLAAHGGQLRPLFNTSGQDYRALALKEKLPTMTADEALQMLSTHGNLVKRPFAIDTKKGICLTGFQEEVWAQSLG
jgi:arsenate reductase (glutaredoxin)